MKPSIRPPALRALLLLFVCACTAPEPSTPTPLTVTGKVVDASGRSVAGASVLLLSEDQPPVKTDTGGSFRIAGVKSPYDVAVGSAWTREVLIYQGVTREQLTLVVPTDPAMPRVSDTLTVAVSGGRTPYTDSQRPQVTLSVPGSTVLRYGVPQSEPGTYLTRVEGRDPGPFTGWLFALQVERSSAIPSDFLGYDRRQVVGNLGSGLPSQTLVLRPVETASLEGTFTPPNGYALSEKSLSAEVSPDITLPLFSDLTPAEHFTYRVPLLPDSDGFTLTARADSSGNASSSLLIKRGVRVGGAPLALELQAAPRLQTPADQAANVTRSTAFSWTGFPGGVHRVTFQDEGSSQAHLVTIFTAAARTTLPDLSRLEMPLAANTPMSWGVTGIKPLASVDDLLEHRERSPVNDLFPELPEVHLVRSESRTFTTSAAP
jgi:hypothetical protein